MMAGTPRYGPDAVRAQAFDLLRGFGLGAEDAGLTADVMIDSDLRGIDTHGIALLVLYAKWADAGGYDFGAKPETIKEGPAFALIDAKNGLGFAVSVRAAELAAQKARSAGIAAVTVRRSHHFGAAGAYARIIAKAGMIGLVATSTKVVCVVPPGARAPVLGTNPLAYAIPRRGAEPIVFDMATSTAAGNKVRLHRLRGEALPEGWVVDEGGRPVTDAAKAHAIVYEGAGGGLTPLGANPVLGSHKGYGLALLVHVLGGTLAGGAFAGSPHHRPEEGDNIGHFFLALDPSIYRGADPFLDDVEEVAATLKGTSAIDPEHPVMLPGDPEQGTLEERSTTGIPLASALVRQLEALAGTLGVPFHLASAES